jgi:hypothetical protein
MLNFFSEIPLQKGGEALERETSVSVSMMSYYGRRKTVETQTVEEDKIFNNTYISI